MRAWAVAAVALLAALAAAGCLQSGRGTDYDAVRTELHAAAALALRADHDEPAGHADGRLHTGAHNLRLVGYSNGVDDTGDPARIPPLGTYNEFAVTSRHTYLVGQSADGSFGGFTILDTSTPARPHVLSRYVALGGADIEVNPEETFAFFATQRNSVEQVAGGAQEAGASAGAAGGIHVVDIADKTAPRLDSFLPLPANGPHTLTFHRHANGSDYLVACTYDLVTDPATGAIAGAVPATQRMLVYLVEPNPLSTQGIPGPKLALVPVAQFQIAEQAPAGKMYFPHDAAVQVHAAAGKTLLTLAYWDKGVRILDFSAPPAPGSANLPSLPEIGSFTGFAPSAFNNMHYAAAFAAPLVAWDGAGAIKPVHVTVAEPEIISAPDETGQVTFLDTTDPTRPEALGHWTLPAQHPPLGVSDLDFSPHNFDTWGGKLAIAHNHAGVWVVDVSTPDNLAAPTEVAFYMTAKPRPDSPVLQPQAWGVRHVGGLLYVSDEATGLYILEYTGP